MKKLTDERLLAITRSLGAQYLLVDDKAALQEMNSGLADVLTSRPVNSATTFNAYSTTKTITAAAIMSLVEQNKILLDEPVNSHFPEFLFSKKFTVRQLLSHQSGISNPLPLKWIHLVEEDEMFEEKAFSNGIISRNTKLRFTPGSKASYTNVGYLLVGLLIEKISGSDFNTFVTENIFNKTATQGVLDFKIHSPVHAAGYHPRYSFSNLLLAILLDKKKYMKPAKGRWIEFKNHYVNGKPYGGLIANAQGLTEYLHALMNGVIVNENSLSLLFTEQKDNICLGWFKGKLGSHTYFCHPGGGGGYYCEIRVYPKLKLSSTVMTNCSGFSDQRLLDKIDTHFIQ